MGEFQTALLAVRLAGDNDERCGESMHREFGRHFVRGPDVFGTGQINERLVGLEHFAAHRFSMVGHGSLRFGPVHYCPADG